jgi:hypothetical protein
MDPPTAGPAAPLCQPEGGALRTGAAGAAGPPDAAAADGTTLGRTLGATDGSGVGVTIGGTEAGGSMLGSSGVGVGVASVDGVGHGSGAGPEPLGVGASNDGTIPEASGVGTTKQLGVGAGVPQLAPLRIGPHDAPYGMNERL